MDEEEARSLTVLFLRERSSLRVSYDARISAAESLARARDDALERQKAGRVARGIRHTGRHIGAD